HAQPKVDWVTVAGTPASEYVADLALSPTGEILVVINDRTGDAPGPETVLYKFDLNGKQTATQASRGEEIRGITVDSKGNYYLTGRVGDSVRLRMGVVNDFYLAKYSPDGLLLWERALGSPGTTLQYETRGGYKLTLDEAGDVLLAAYSSGAATFGDVTFPAETGGPLLCKYDPDGNLIWARRGEGQGGAIIGGLTLDPDGNMVISGFLFN